MSCRVHRQTVSDVSENCKAFFFFFFSVKQSWNSCTLLGLLDPKYEDNTISRNVGKLFTSLHGVTSQKTSIFGNTAVRTSNIGIRAFACKFPYKENSKNIFFLRQKLANDVQFLTH
jgi:hypothetical protein